MRVVAAILIVLLLLAVVVLGAMCYALSQDVAEFREQTSVEREHANELSQALDRVLVEREELIEENRNLQTENENMAQQFSTLRGESEQAEGNDVTP